MRTRLSLAFAVGLGLASLVACTSDPDVDPAARPQMPAGPGASTSPDGGTAQSTMDGGRGDAEAKGDPRTPGDGGVAPDGATPAGSAIAGSVIDMWTNQPMASIGMRLVGADGVAQDVVTDTSGKFSAPNVVLPYDLAILRDGTLTPVTGYLGLSQVTPRVRWGSDRGSQRSGDVKIAVDVPSCGADRCTVMVAMRGGDSDSPGSEGVVTMGAPRFETTLSMRFFGPTTRAATIWAVVKNAAGSYYAAGSTSVTVSDGGTTIAPAIAPKAVAVAGTFSVEAESVGIPLTWSVPNIAPFLRLPSGPQMYLPQVSTGLLSTTVPQIPGASAWAGITYRDPLDRNTYAQAWTKEVPVGTTLVKAKAYGPPTILQPQSGADLAMADAIEWDDGVGTPATYYLDVGGAGSWLTLLTDGTRVSFQRLAALGMTVTPAADWNVQVNANRPFASVDELLSPAGAAVPWSDRFSASSTTTRAFSLVP